MRRPERLSHRSATRRRRGRLAAGAIALVACYYLAPVHDGSSGHRLWLRGAGAAALLAVALWLVVRAVLRQVHADDAAVQLDRLALAALGGVLVFALADVAIAHQDPAQFAGLTTKTDGLYFTLTVLSTVGFGDVHAVGQLARGVVIAQLVFNAVILTTAARTLTRGLSGRNRRSRPPDERPYSAPGSDG